MKKISTLFAALLCCLMNVTLHADNYLYDYNGLHFVLTESPFGSQTIYSAYLVHPEADLEIDNPATPSSYTGEIVVPDTIFYEGKQFAVKFIHDNTFSQSTVTSVDVPATVVTFSNGAFYNCTELRTLICRASTPPTTIIHTIPWDYEDIFGSLDPNQVSVYVPEESVSDYQNDSGWGVFSHIYPIAAEDIDTVHSSSLQGGDGGRLILLDSQLLILRGDKTYTLSGIEIQ